MKKKDYKIIREEDFNFSGKSSFGSHIVFELLKRGDYVLHMTLESSMDQHLNKLIK